MSAIMMSQLTVNDPDKFADYLQRSKAIASRYGAELLFSGKYQETLNGDPRVHRMVLIAQFPDYDALSKWHSDPDYADLVPLRDVSSDQIMTTYSE